MNNIKLIVGEICSALLGNINRNISEISINVPKKDEVHIQFILSNKTQIEQELINDALCEFEALHSNLSELNWSILLEIDNAPSLNYKIFEKYNL